MNKQMREVMQRRGELLARITSQREQLADMGDRWQAPLALADKGLAAARFLRANPLVVASVVALLLVRRRGVIGLVKVGWRMWKGYRFYTAFSAKLAARR